MRENYMMTANDVSNELNISKGHAYKIVRKLNEELSKEGYIIVAGKIPRAYWEKRFFGFESEKTIA